MPGTKVCCFSIAIVVLCSSVSGQLGVTPTASRHVQTAADETGVGSSQHHHHHHHHLEKPPEQPDGPVGSGKEMVAPVGRLMEIQTAALLGPDLQCHDKQVLVQDLPSWMLHDQGTGLLQGVPTSLHAGQSSTLTILCPSADHAWKPVVRLTVFVVSPPSKASPWLPSDLFSGGVADHTTLPKNAERKKEDNMVMDVSGGALSSSTNAVASSQTLNSSESIERMTDAGGDKSPWTVNTFHESRQCAEEYVTSLVLCHAPDKLNASQRVQVIQRASDFLSIHKTSLTWLTSYDGHFHSLDQGYTVESAGSSNHIHCLETMNSELYWPLSCSAGRHIAEFTKILQHNVQVGRLQQEMGVEVFGWYVAAKVPRMALRRRRRQVQRRTPVPTPVLQPSSSFSSSQVPFEIDFTKMNSVSFSTKLPETESSLPASEPSVLREPYIRSYFSDFYSSSMDPQPWITQHEHVAFEQELSSFYTSPYTPADVVSTSSAFDDARMTLIRSENVRSLPELKTSVSETDAHTSRFLSLSMTPTPVLLSMTPTPVLLSMTPTPVLLSVAAEESHLSAPGEHVSLHSSFSSRIDDLISKHSVHEDRQASMSQTEHRKPLLVWSSSLDTLETSLRLDDTTLLAFLYGSAENLIQLGSTPPSSAMDRSESFKESEITELSYSLQSSFAFATSSPRFARTTSRSDTFLPPSSFVVESSSQVWPLTPAEEDDLFSTDTLVHPPVIWSQMSALGLSQDDAETTLTARVTQGESWTTLTARVTQGESWTTADRRYTSLTSLQQTPVISYSAVTEGPKPEYPNIQSLASSIQMTDDLELSTLPTHSSAMPFQSRAMQTSDQSVSTFRDSMSRAQAVMFSSVMITSREFALTSMYTSSDVSVFVSTTERFLPSRLGEMSSHMLVSQELFPGTSFQSESARLHTTSAAPESVSDKRSLHPVVRLSVASESVFTRTAFSASPMFSSLILPTRRTVDRDFSTIQPFVDPTPLETESDAFLPSYLISATEISPIQESLSTFAVYSSQQVVPSVQDELITDDVRVTASVPFLSSPLTETSSLYVSAEIDSSFMQMSHVHFDETLSSFEVEKTVDSSVSGVLFSASGIMLTSDTEQFMTDRSESVSLTTQIMSSTPLLSSLSPSAIPVSILDTSCTMCDSVHSVILSRATIMSTPLRSSETVTPTFHAAAVNQSDVHFDTQQAGRETTDLFDASWETTEYSTAVTFLASELQPSDFVTTSTLDIISRVATVPGDSGVTSPSAMSTVSVKSTATTPSSLTASSSSDVTSSFFVSSSPTMSSHIDVTSESAVSSTLTDDQSASTSTASSVSTRLRTTTSSPAISTNSSTPPPSTAAPTRPVPVSNGTSSQDTLTDSTTSFSSSGWRTVSQQPPVLTTPLTVNTTLGGPNNPPMVVNPMNYLSTILGRYFEWHVPRDMFSDLEDGDTRSLTLTLTLPRRNQTLPASFWVQFDPVRQVMYGLPLVADLDTGYHSVVIVATDSGGLRASNVINLHVNSSALALITHRFVMEFTVGFSQVMQRRDTMVTVLKKISSYYGDRSTEYVTVVEVNTGSFIFSWTNSSLSGSSCPAQTVHTNLNRMVRADGTIRRSFSRHIGKNLKLRSVVLRLQGACLHPDPTTHVPATGDKEPAATRADLVRDIVMPVIIALLLVLLLVILVLFVRRYRKRRGSMETLDDKLFAAEPGPVVLHEEPPDADLRNAGPKTPTILLCDQDPAFRSYSAKYPSSYQHGGKVGSVNLHRPDGYGVDGERAHVRPVTVIFNNFETMPRHSRSPGYWGESERCRERSPNVRFTPSCANTTSV